MFGYGFSYGFTKPKLPGILGDVLPPVGTPPVNTRLPEIVGTPQDGTSWRFDAGDWDPNIPITSMDIEIRTTESTPTILLARQDAASVSNLSIDGLVGKSIVFSIWAIGPGGTTQATSAPFGPIVAAGDVHYLAVSFSDGPATVPSSPIQWINATATGRVLDASALYPQAVPGHAGALHGFTGTNLDQQAIRGVTNADNRINGSIQSNLTGDQLSYRLSGIPPGVYKIYAAMLAHTTIATNMQVRDGNGNILHSLPDVVVTTSQVRDATGAIRTLAQWQTDSEVAGNPVEVTIPATTGGSTGDIYISRTAGGVAPRICAIAIQKKAA